ncbi:glucose-1-phosphate thymidylyltransferase RfbA [Phytoactinopolyspora limicola]|uniref:glucose-1-phosphate thymidylyltransferase RfbA n=1 Tax=Phytoactinopolyspora limicola TaxID=2715536 RepID=UPI00140AA351|nr:glucose-1-phosphate thymidylyltransferase RfbA [Phytoactinopolyspora limicola]
MKGIVLAGGSGTRLSPITVAVSKQLLPVYDKPMVYYPLSVLMLTGISDILIITTPRDEPLYQRLLGDGSWLGVHFSYAHQTDPNGLAEALIIGAEHVGDDNLALILGDNIFHGPGFSERLQQQAATVDGCVLFGYAVSDPRHYGVARLDQSGRLIAVEEKPRRPSSNLAVTGLYFYTHDAVEIASRLKPSDRGELEITDVNQAYVERGHASLVNLGRGFTWMDAGTHESLLRASEYVQMLEERQGVRIACLEEVAWRMGFISALDCYRLGEQQANSAYGRYLMDLPTTDPRALVHVAAS